MSGKFNVHFVDPSLHVYKSLEIKGVNGVPTSKVIDLFSSIMINNHNLFFNSTFKIDGTSIDTTKEVPTVNVFTSHDTNKELTDNMEKMIHAIVNQCILLIENNISLSEWVYPVHFTGKLTTILRSLPIPLGICNVSDLKAFLEQLILAREGCGPNRTTTVMENTFKHLLIPHFLGLQVKLDEDEVSNDEVIKKMIRLIDLQRSVNRRYFERGCTFNSL